MTSDNINQEVQDLEVAETGTTEIISDVAEADAGEILSDENSELLGKEPETEGAVSEESVPASFLSDQSLMTEKSLEKFKSADDLAKSYVHLNKLLGKKMSDMSPEETQVMHQHLGVPQDALDYAAPDLPGIDSQRVDTFKPLAKEPGLTDTQFKGLVESVVAMETDQMTRYNSDKQAVYQGWKDELKEEYGQAFSDNIKIANAAINAYDDDKQALNVLKQHGLASNPAIVKMLNKIGKDLTEDNMVEGNASKTFAMTPREAEHKINQTRSLYKDALQNRTHPDHVYAIQELKKLYDMKKV